MPTDSRTNTGPIAVTGATGQQGGATARALLESGDAVRAIVRNPDAPPARRLADAGAQLVIADFDRPETLRAAFEGARAVFAMATFTGPDGPDGEVRHGMAIGDAAVGAGVPYVVYSSVGGAERHTGIPHFESKRRIEEHLEGLAVRTTFLRPAFFMENFATYSAPTVDGDMITVRLPIPPDVPLQIVATRDIATIAAIALQDPDRIRGGALEIAGDELTGQRIAAEFGRDAGLTGVFESIPLEALAGNPDQQAMFRWFSESPAYQADIAAVRELVPDLQDLRAWLAAR